MVKICFRELPSFQTSKLTYENSMLGAFSCDFTVVANDVIMQRTQRCLGPASETGTLLSGWLGPFGPSKPASMYIGLECQLPVTINKIKACL